MVRERVINLFSQAEGFEQADELVQQLNAKKRGCYNTKPKIVDYNPYTHMQHLYGQLANLIGIRLFSKDDAIFRYRGLKIWTLVYTAEEYQYENKVYQGEQFQVNQAEIRGTENFILNDRIKLHERLIELLRQHVELKYAIKLVQQDVRELQKKYKVKEFTQWLKKQRI